MCLGIPGKVVEMTDPDAYLAKVDVNGIRRTISIRLLADTGLDIGDWVLVHVGFAMAKIDEREAAATLAAVAKMGQAYRDELDAFKSSTVSLEGRRHEVRRRVQGPGRRESPGEVDHRAGWRRRCR